MERPDSRGPPRVLLLPSALLKPRVRCAGDADLDRQTLLAFKTLVKAAPLSGIALSGKCHKAHAKVHAATVPNCIAAEGKVPHDAHALTISMQGVCSGGLSGFIPIQMGMKHQPVH